MGKTFYFIGCLTREKFPREKKHGIELIQAIDPTIMIDDDFPCCGSFLFQHGLDREIYRHVEYVNGWLKEKGIDKIITPCAGCYHYFQMEYPKYIDEFAKKVKIFHVIQYIAMLAEEEKLPFDLVYRGDSKLKITYHDGCHLRNSQPPVVDEPRKVIERIKGNVKFKEMDRNRDLSTCCGAGGGVRALFPIVKDYNTQLILKQARLKLARYIITGCPFCYLSFVEANDKIKPIKFEVFINKLRRGEDIDE
ncbi:MAG: (Fe-S)-binding protein [Promethearchaeota archaeon]